LFSATRLLSKGTVFCKLGMYPERVLKHIASRWILSCFSKLLCISIAMREDRRLLGSGTLSRHSNRRAVEEGGASGGQQSTTFSCLTRRNHKTISSLISYYSQLVPQTHPFVPTRIKIVLDQVVDPVSDRSEAADVFRPPRAPSTLFERQDTHLQLKQLSYPPR
jgi:hypothetical protein